MDNAKEDNLEKDFFDLFPTSKEECQAAFMPLDVPAPRGPIFVFGEYFLRKFYTVFDRDESVLGFSVASHQDTLDTNQLNIRTPYDGINENENSNGPVTEDSDLFKDLQPEIQETSQNDKSLNDDEDD